MTREEAEANIRVATTEQLVDFCQKAIEAAFNRQINLDRLWNRIDPAGAHVVTPLMMHEHIGGQPSEMHMRCDVLIKVKFSNEPVTAILDIWPTDIEALPSYADLRVTGQMP